ncbi:MAG: radical SAM protein, partial [Myxococcales bacterium]|nr:radical SAM protein [Myxococcales bacterium]
MKLADARKRLPIVDALPRSRSRRVLPRAPGEPRRPRFAVWEITLACDHGCRHCGPRAGRARPDELTTEECLRLVDELAELGVGEVSLIGGEPYLRADFVLILRAIRARGMAASMVTGGLNLTRARAEAATQAGVQNVSVSIDGLESTHDHLRARVGSWRRAFAALRELRRAGATISSNTQINPRTWRELPALLELLAAEGVYAWQVQLTSLHGNAADHPELLLQPYELPAVFESLAALARRSAALGVKLVVANSVGYFGPHAHALRHNQNPHGHFLGCQAGVWHVAIESDGMIKSCPSLGGPSN